MANRPNVPLPTRPLVPMPQATGVQPIINLPRPTTNLPPVITPGTQFFTGTPTIIAQPGLPPIINYPGLPNLQPFTGILPPAPLEPQRKLPNPRPNIPGIVQENQYYPQYDPAPEDFAFNARPENSELIQATIATARLMFPSLETHIQVAEAVGILTNLRRRNQFPVYLRDASPYEIYKIYHTEASVDAIAFFQAFDELMLGRYPADIPAQYQDIINDLRAGGIMDPSHGELNDALQARYQERMFGPVGIRDPNIRNVAREMFDAMDNIQNIMRELRMQQIHGADYHQYAALITAEMQRRGYAFQYTGFVRADQPAIQARVANLPLTPENFVATITPDKVILMEAWRKEALKGGISQMGTVDLLELKELVRQVDPLDVGGKPPVLQTIGFSNEQLRNAILATANRIDPNRQPTIDQWGMEGRRILPITRDYIRYQGEEAEYICGRKKHNINNKGLAMNEHMGKPYYMMLYNELRLRGLLDGTVF